MPKGFRKMLLGLEAKGNKNQKIRNEHLKSFWHIFQGKKELPFPDQYGANKKISKISPAIMEEIGFRQTDRQTSYYLVILI